MNITVTNHKGGCGKSTTAVHVAAYMAREFGEGSVVLVDTDPNGSAMEWAARGGRRGCHSGAWDRRRRRPRSTPSSTRRGAQSGWEDYKAAGRELVEVVGGEPG